MVDYLPRSAWGARAPRSGPGSLTVSRVQGVVLHWPGMGDRRIGSKATVASALRGWQDYHMDDKGWSDIAYQVAVDQEGRAWTLRGLRTQSGANGDNEVNEDYAAVLLIVGTGEHPTLAMIATTRAVVQDFRGIYPNCKSIKPHSAVRPDPTDCPGDLVRKLITAGAFNPGAIIPEDDMPYTKAELQEIAQAGAYAADQKYGGDLWASPTGTGTHFIANTKAGLAALTTQVAGLTAAVKALAEHQGVDPDTVVAAVQAATKEALADLKITLAVDDGNN